MNNHRYSTSSIRSQYKGVEKMAVELKVDINEITKGYAKVWLEHLVKLPSVLEKHQEYQ